MQNCWFGVGPQTSYKIQTLGNCCTPCNKGFHDNYSAAKDKVLYCEDKELQYRSVTLSEHNNMDVSPSIPLANSSCACDSSFGTGSCSESLCYQQLDFIPYLDLSSTMSPLAQELDTSFENQQQQQQLIDCKF